MSSLIDYVVLLDQPLELFLSRIIKRHTDPTNSGSLNSVSNFLDKYDDHFRDIYLVSANEVRRHCDLIIKGSVSTQETTNAITNWLKINITT
jgi:hypothetical protein